MPTIDLGTHQLRYQVSGSGPAVVLLHGLADDLSVWEGQVKDLAKQFRVVRYDHRGHGGSTAPPGPTGIPELAADLLALLDSLGIETVCPVGHSMGGRTAFQFALTRPDRIWALVSMDAQSEAPPDDFRAVIADMHRAAKEEGMAALWRTFLAAGELPDRVHLDQEFGQLYEARFLANRPAAVLACLEGILAMPRLTSRLHTIRVPTLAIVGERDSAYLDFARQYQESIADCRAVVIPGVGHCPHVDAPEIVNATLMEFLRRPTSPNSQ